MWEIASARIRNSVAAIMRPYRIQSTGQRGYRAAGSAFQIACEGLPTLLTCAHVVADGHCRPFDDLELGCNFGSKGPHLLGARVLKIKPELDLAILETGTELQGQPVDFRDRALLLPMGTAVAAIGFPTQSEPEEYVDGSRGCCARSRRRGSSPAT